MMDQSLIERILDMAVAIQQIPAPTFKERQRATFVYERFQEEGLSDVSIDALGNVAGRLPGSGNAEPLVVSAHLDTVFPDGTPLVLRREMDKVYGPGIGDNALGVAGLFGLLWAVREESLQWFDQDRSKLKTKPLQALHSELPGDIWLVADVGEEGLGNLCGMRAVVDRFAAQVQAYIVLEGMALGQVYHRGLSVKRYQIITCTPGGHAWVDYGGPSAIHELASMITRLCALPLPAQPRTSMNVGVISGGTTVNSIAAQAECLLDLRSEDQRTLSELASQVEALVKAGNRTGVQFIHHMVGERPAGALPDSHPLVRLAAHCLEAQGIQPALSIGSTDANIPLSRGLPAVCVGLTTGGGAHTPGEFIYVQPLALGLSQLLALVNSIFQSGYGN
jgi:acetylornithine deacetylase/succinyl-diaminopimelate desuccinylase-like protein